jgi:hypothetical protein
MFRLQEKCRLGSVVAFLPPADHSDMRRALDHGQSLPPGTCHGHSSTGTTNIRMKRVIMKPITTMEAITSPATSAPNLAQQNRTWDT